jgi:hypothetical protein
MRQIPAMSNFFRRSIVVLALGPLVTGCLTTSPEQQAKLNEERCLNRGYKPGTDGFSDCVVRVDSERDTRLQARHREAVEKSGIPSSNRGY